MYHLMNKNTVSWSITMSENMKPLLTTKIRLILPSAITNLMITTLTTLGRLNLYSEWTQLMDKGLMINQIKLFHYHKGNQINISRSLLTTHYKSQCVTNARELLKHIEDCNNINDHARKIKLLEDCNNINDHARKIKSLNQTWQYYLRNLFLSLQIHVIIYGTWI